MTRAGIFVLVTFVALHVASPAVAQLPPATLKAVRAATVLIKLPRSSGSGVIVHKDGRAAYVVTNQHVVSDAVNERLPISVVTASGEPGEKAFPAELNRFSIVFDLALLKIEGDDLPAPIPMALDVTYVETSPIYVFGFPFGEMLAVQGANPAIAISQGTISSVRRNPLGRVGAVQITADINPGNSGGPVIDPRGRLVGIAVAKILQTQIGFAIPMSTVHPFLYGLSDVELEFKQPDPKQPIEMTVKGLGSSPVEPTRGAVLHIARLTPDFQPREGERLAVSLTAKDYRRMSLRAGKDDVLEGKIRLTGWNPGDEMVVQLVTTTKSGQAVFHLPELVRIRPSGRVNASPKPEGEQSPDTSPKPSPPGQTTPTEKPSAPGSLVTHRVGRTPLEERVAELEKKGFADSGWVEQATDELEVKVDTTERLVRGPTSNLAGVFIQEIAIQAIARERSRRPARLSADGRHLFITDRDSSLFTVELPGLIQKAKHVFPTKITALEVTRGSPVRPNRHRRHVCPATGYADAVSLHPA